MIGLMLLCFLQVSLVDEQIEEDLFAMLDTETDERFPCLSSQSPDELASFFLDQIQYVCGFWSVSPLYFQCSWYFWKFSSSSLCYLLYGSLSKCTAFGAVCGSVVRQFEAILCDNLFFKVVSQLSISFSTHQDHTECTTNTWTVTRGSLSCLPISMAPIMSQCCKLSSIIEELAPSHPSYGGYIEAHTLYMRSLLL